MADDAPVAGSAARAQPTAPPSRHFLAAIAIAILIMGFLLIKPFLGALAFGLVFGFLLQPLKRRLLALSPKRTNLTASVVVVIVALALVLPFAFIIQQVADDALLIIDLARDRQGAETAIVGFLEGSGVDPAEARQLVSDGVDAAVGVLQDIALAAATQVTNVMASLFIFFFVLYFTVRDGPAMIAGVRRVLPLRDEARDHLIEHTGQATRAIVVGAFLVALLQGAAAGIGWALFGLPAPVFWGFVMTILALIPFLGPFLVMIPAGLIVMLDGDVLRGMLILLYAMFIVGLLDNVVRPYIVGRSSKIHPVVILVGTLGGILFFGPSGLLLGPLLGSLIWPILEIWANDRRALAAAVDDDPATHGG